MTPTKAGKAACRQIWARGRTRGPPGSIRPPSPSALSSKVHPTYLAGLEPIFEGMRKAGVPEQ